MSALDFVIFGFGLACFSLFLEFCFQDGEILGWYYALIFKMPVFIAKPIGFCIYCTNFWLCTGLYLGNFEFSLIHFFILIGVSHVSIKYLSNILQ